MKLRMMHVKPDGVNRTWDIILLDDRQNARVHMNQEGTEFVDIVILDGFPTKHYDAVGAALAAMPVDGGELFMPEDNVIR